MLSDREKLELRDVVRSAIEPEFAQLRKELAETVVVILEEFSNDLAKVFANSNRELAEHWRAERDARAAKKGPRVGF